jgi:outer membrane protein assembly factor BamE (lipoprotein component of BamABCDE complex)
VAAIGLVLGVALTGCIGETITRGYVLDEKTLGELKPGTSVEKVLATLGTPSTVSTVGNKTFYYISQTTQRRVQFLEASVTDQRVLAIYFDKNFKIERVANYGLKDGVVFDFITRTTPTSGGEQSFVRQLFRGLGTFNPFGA